MAASGSRHEIRYVPEVTMGTTPAGPTMKRLRNTGSTLNLTKEALTSAEIRADRQITDQRHGARRIGGDVNFELSYGAFDEFLAGVMFGEWNANVLKAGTTLKTFTLERAFTDVSQFLVYTGCAVNSMSLQVQPNRMLTGTFGMIGLNMDTDVAQLGVATDVATNPVMDSFTGSLQEGGSPNAVVTSLSLDVNNGIDPSFVIMKNAADDLTYGRSNVTGRISCKFNDLAMYNKFVNEVESSLSITLDGVGGDYTILLPRIKYTGGDIPVSGEGPVVLDMPFQALLDPVTGTNLQITRVPG